MIKTLQDGTIIEYKMSGNGNAPDKQFGMRTNCTTYWYRINNMNWICDHRRHGRLRAIIDQVNNLEEFNLLINDPEIF